MEKLSSILPSNARIRSVDTKDSKPARPGAPLFGRPQGTLSVKDRFSVSKEAVDRAAQDLSALRNGKEFARARMVEDISNKFFETRLSEPAQTTEKAIPSEIAPIDFREAESSASSVDPLEQQA
jgi:hypothetical protein